MTLSKFSRGPILTPLALALALSPVSAFAQQVSQGFAGMKLAGDQPVQIESDKLEVRQQDNLAIFTGNVAVVQGTSLLKAGKLTVFYAKDGASAASGSAAIERLEVNGKVYFKSEDKIATGDTGTFNMKTEVLVLAGASVVLTQGASVATGCKLTVQMKSGMANLEGCGKGKQRVQALLPPQSQKKK